MRAEPPGLKTLLIIAALCLGCQACSIAKTERGVETRWQNLPADTFVAGETTRQQVLAMLGPPSQVLTLHNETALYYMLERTRGSSMVLLVFNSRSERSRYDRAVFFFNLDGLLTEYALTEAQEK